jgi:parallel beta-helix repeat protein
MNKRMEESESLRVYYVAPYGDDNWSGTLPQPDTAGSDGPFRTITAARDSIRKMIASCSENQIEIQIREGSYNLDETLVFDERDSGLNGNPVTYRNYPGEYPVIHGGRRITGWKRHDEKAFKVPMKAGAVHTLFENGVFAVKARYPKKGYLNTGKMDKASPTGGFHFERDSIPPMGSTDNLQTFIWPGGPEGEWNWCAQVINVDEINYETEKITLHSQAVYDIGEGSRYFLQGARELLNIPGEFHYEASERMLYYIPRQLPIEDQEIIVPQMLEIIRFQGASPGKPVKDIRLIGLTIRCSDITEEVIDISNEAEGTTGSAIHLENAQGIVVKDCKISNTGLHGIFIRGWAQGNTVYGNLIRDIGHTGVQLEGALKSSLYINKQNTIENNLICNTGILVGHGAGIQLVQSGENRVRYNRIYHTPRYSISLKSFHQNVLLGQEIEGVTVNDENVGDFLHCNKNILEYNDVSDGNYDSQDTGLIESWGFNRDTVIRYNCIHDSNINFSFGFGIYIDDAGARFTIEGNILYRLQREGGGRLLYPIYDKGYQDRIINNIVADNHVFRAAVGTFEMIYPNREITSERNIFCNSGDIYYFQNWDDKRFARSDFNLFYSREGRYGVLDEIRDYVWGSKELGGVAGIKWRTLSLEEWGEVPGKHFDRHSIVADPLFMNQQEGDYRLRFDSPAYNLGFEDIDYAEIGLKEDFAFLIGDEVPATLFIKSHTGGCKSAVNLAPGGQERLDVVARNQSGVILSLHKDEVSYRSENEETAVVDGFGRITAKGTGSSRITVSVTQNGVTTMSEIDVLVE